MLCPPFQNELPRLVDAQMLVVGLRQLQHRIPDFTQLSPEEIRWKAAGSHLRSAIPTVSAVLARELRDLFSVHSEWLSREVPGFAAALARPEMVDRAWGEGT